MTINCPTCCKPRDRQASAIRDYEDVLARMASEYNDLRAYDVLNKHNPGKVSSELVRLKEDKDERRKARNPEASEG